MFEVATHLAAAGGETLCGTRAQLDQGRLGALALKDGVWLEGGDQLAELGYLK